MDLFIRTELQRQWVARLDEIGRRFAEDAQERDERGEYPVSQIRELAASGYTALAVPPEFGGAGIGVYEMVLFQETIAKYDENLALSVGWNLGVPGAVFEKKDWDPGVLRFFADELIGGALVNRSVSEVLTGSPSRGGRPGTTAVRDGERYVISGRKSFTTGSPALTYFLTSAWIEDKERIGFFLLHKDLDGLSVDETWDVVSMRGTGSHDLVLDGVSVEEGALVELPEKPAGGPAFDGWLLHLPAAYLGIAQAARDWVIAFADRHSPNSVKGPISGLPNVRQLIGEIELELMQARHVLYSVAEAYDDENRRPLMTGEVPAAKTSVTNAAISIVDKAMRIAGAQSLQRTNPLQRYYRNARAGLHNPPADDMTIRSLAETAVEQSRSRRSVKDSQG
ncbi:acyl-CoA dehydrogenase family protein [Edaphobacillus lindanitolerans]|uniref:Acyl-CoA dehydrogenase n=1 Tax=Edaphobacillus lindanitolerans TaxID=550447 RepID=A0A1U7PR12_9BACI|nr:acyl-CoA dehydrogenase family protein [Edaphobacillus lindanitolerans]SIT92748.1 Acyl-CoA dehydrogenase [Edaphobacillus lindanitolerans]